MKSLSSVDSTKRHLLTRKQWRLRFGGWLVSIFSTKNEIVSQKIFGFMDFRKNGYKSKLDRDT